MYRGNMWRAGLLLVVAGCTHSQHGSDGDGPPKGGPFTIAGTVTGLSGNGLVLQDERGDDISITSDGAFVFATPIAYGARYDVTVSQQPIDPSQGCTVANGSGTALADVGDVQITCMTASFAIGGTIVGLDSAGLVLHDGSTGEDLPVPSSSTTFSFIMPVASGAGYEIHVGTQPMGQTCSVANGSGTVIGSNISDVAVTCMLAQLGVACGGAFCNPATEGCCDPSGTPTCSSAASCGSIFLACDDDADCPAGNVCCAIENNIKTKVRSSSCVAAGTCNASTDVVMCDPNNPMCPSGTCKAFGLLPGYYACQ
jgi:hypothetical protein